MKLSPAQIEEFKEICKKEGITFNSEAEMLDAANRLIAYAEIAYKYAEEEARRQHRLKSELKGFSIKGEGQTCGLCMNSHSDELWYDKWGMKCMDCQLALNQKIIPGYVFKDRDNRRHVTDLTLQYSYKVPSKIIRRLVKEGRLKARAVEGDRKTLVFLKKENENLSEVIRQELK